MQLSSSYGIKVWSKVYKMEFYCRLQQTQVPIVVHIYKQASSFFLCIYILLSYRPSLLWPSDSPFSRSAIK